MVSLDDLRDARLTDVEASAASWTTFATRFAALEQDAVSDVVAPVYSSKWEGQAADAALPHIDGIDDGLGLVAEQARTVGALVEAAARRLRALQRQLELIQADARAAGARIRDDGSVEPPYLTATESADEREAAVAARRHNETARGIADRLNTVLAEATRVDEQYAAALLRYEHPPCGVISANERVAAARDARDSGPLLGADRSRIPAAGTSPAKTAAWWRGLSRDQQAAYVAAYPNEIGALDGVPTMARDHANRGALATYVASQRQLAGIDRITDNSAFRVPAEKLLDRLEASEYSPASRRLYLLGFDPQWEQRGDGRAIVAVGNPDTTHHTSVMVPGVGSTLDGMNSLIGRAEAVQFQADRFARGPDGDVSVIAWLDYDAPETDGGAVSDHQSEVGGKRLDQFVDGLRATGPDQAHLSVIGHSYGSTLVGEADSHDNGLAVDDVITVGSPGMNVDHVTDLKTPADHVWAGSAPGDPISDPRVPGWVQATAPGFAHVLDDVLGDPHNIEPTEEDFGANRFHVDTRPGDHWAPDFDAHSSYWDKNGDTPTAQLNNQARIVIGQYSLVGLDLGSAPPDLPEAP